MRLKKEDIELIRAEAERDLLAFIRLVAPHRVLGDVHVELIRWWEREDAKDNQLVLLPRDHQKSAMIAYRVAWWITKHPETTILYISATATLAEKQLKMIKDILTSDTYRFYWPEMVNEQENRRERWTNEEIAVDHPKRKAEGVRDATVMAKGLTATLTGLHCNVAVLDDLVVPDNAYTESGRAGVQSLYSQLASIQTTDAKEWVVGTRYHPADLYKDLLDMVEIYYDADKDDDVEVPVYESFERKVETNGEFLWPKQRRTDGKAFGFDDRVLARKKAKYIDVTQFFAQYYNNPNAVEVQHIDRSRFLYYNRENVTNISGVWYVGENMVHVYAGIDFAYSLSSTADYTTIVVVGVDEHNNIYVLDIDRFKTNKISVMYDKCSDIYRKWKFKKLRMEVVAGQSLIEEQFKEYMRSQRVIFSIDPYHPPKSMKKEERIAMILEPRYTNGMMWHYKGGNCQVLEEELLLNNPEHDDVKDALASVVEIAKPPMSRRGYKKESNVIYSNRFGGVSYAG